MSMLNMTIMLRMIAREDEGIGGRAHICFPSFFLYQSHHANDGKLLTSVRADSSEARVTKGKQNA